MNTQNQIKKYLILLLDTFVIGLIGTICASIFIFLLDLISKFALGYIAGYIPSDTINIISSHINHPFSPVNLIIVIVTGGLISGFLVYTFAPEAEGDGTDTIIRAYHRTGGYVRGIVTFIKILASAITIGTGGSAGREGPTTLFGGGVGSIYANFRNASLEKRRLFVIIGMASSLSVVFKAPMGTAIFSIEVLYSELEYETRELLFVFFGPLVSYIFSAYIFGWQPIFTLPSNLQITDIKTYIEIILLGIISGLVSVLIPNVFYNIRDFFRKLPIKPYFKPALGALFVGIIGIYIPQALDGGYGWVQKAINGNFTENILILLFAGKLLAFSLTIGSGGSGGVFAPTLFIGAMLGAFLAIVFHNTSAIFSVIAMAAVFGAAARTPLASIVIVIEMAGGYSLLPATILAVFFSSITHKLICSVFNVKYISLYEAQLLNKNYSLFYQIKTLKNILFCYQDLLQLNPSEIEKEEIVELLESGAPIKLPNNKYLFFGKINKNAELKKEGYIKKFKDLRVLYIFRNGEWYHPSEMECLKENDEVLVYGAQSAINKLSSYFTPVSEYFSKLKRQHEKLEEDINKPIPIK
jgi:CIC family chloride channel protein